MPVMELDQATIVYARFGERGPCVLLVPGVGVLGEAWQPQIDGLSAYHQLAWLDHRGVGRSVPLRGPVTISDMARDCLALLEHLGWPSAHLVGHSMGGVVAQEAARLAPARVISLTLLATARRGRDAVDLSPAALWMRLRGSIGDERTRWLRHRQQRRDRDRDHERPEHPTQNAEPTIPRTWLNEAPRPAPSSTDSHTSSVPINTTAAPKPSERP